MKYTNAEILEIINQDGIGEAIQSLNCKKIDDQTLATLWDDARELLEQIETYLSDNSLELADTDDDDADEDRY